MANIKITFEGRDYIWDGKRWYDAKTYFRPPKVIVSKLNELIEDHFEAEDAAIIDPDKLIEKARETLDSGQSGRALRLAKRAHESRPDDPGVASVLSSVLRKMGHPDQALRVTNRFTDSNYPPVLTSRAAALCDLERLEEALVQIRKVLAIGPSAEAFSVHRRIKAAAPHLFKK